MNAMQRFKVQSGKTFPSHGEVLAVARSLGYRSPRRARPAADGDDFGDERHRGPDRRPVRRYSDPPALRMTQTAGQARLSLAKGGGAARPFSIDRSG